MATKVLALLSLLLLLGTYGAAQTPEESQGCVWTAVAQNCDDVRCPPDTLEVTRGKSGICPKVVPEQICDKGEKKLCCPRTLQLRNCAWTGTAPFCTSKAKCYWARIVGVDTAVSEVVRVFAVKS